MKRSAWIALVIVAIGLAAVPEIAGRKTEARTREIVAAFNRGSSPWRAVVTSYDRGWLRSSSVVRFQANGGADLVEVRTTWRHAPAAGLAPASGTAGIRLLGFAETLARPYLGEAPLATATLVVALNGTLQADIATPAFDVAANGARGSRVSGSGSSGTLSIDSAGRFRTSHAYGKLTLADRGSTIDVQEASVSANGRLGDEGFVDPAAFALSAKAIRAGGDAWSASFADVTFAARVVPHAESIDFRFGHTLGPGHVDERGHAHRWNRIEFQVTLGDIARTALLAIARETRDAADLPATDARRGQRTLEAWSNAAKALLERDPTLSLDKLTYESADGTLSITGIARIDRARTSPAGLANLPAAVAVVARVSISRALARKWIVASLLRSDAEAATQAKADDVLGSLAAAGLIREGADPIVVEIVAKDGRVLLNGMSAERLAELKAALLPPPARPSR